MEYQNADAIIVAIVGGGIHIGAHLSKLLGLPMEVIPCKKIKHPANDNKTIGAVCAESVVIHEEDNHIPQDYLCRQIQLLQHIIRMQNEKYHKGTLKDRVRNKVVILVDDVLMTGDTMLASLETIKKYNPQEVVVAIPIVTPEGARAIAGKIDKLMFLTIEPQPVGKLFAEFPDVSEDEVLSILQQSRPKPDARGKVKTKA